MRLHAQLSKADELLKAAGGLAGAPDDVALLVPGECACMRADRTSTAPCIPSLCSALHLKNYVSACVWHRLTLGDTGVCVSAAAAFHACDVCQQSTRHLTRARCLPAL